VAAGSTGEVGALSSEERLLMGIAIGTEYAVGWPLMAEFSPTHLRGRLMAAMGIA
jgi:MFS transporter, putative metabolite transport protein